MMFYKPAAVSVKGGTGTGTKMVQTSGSCGK